MASIGDTLREARMRQRLDIADLEARTKIRAKYLRALENEEFGMLPGPTFVKTFLRTYAEALGLDPHVLVETYRASYEPRDEMEHLQPLGPAAGARDRRRPPRPRGPWLAIGVAIAAVVAALIVIGLVGNDDEGGDGQAAKTTTTQAKKQAKPKRRREASGCGSTSARRAWSCARTARSWTCRPAPTPWGSTSRPARPSRCRWASDPAPEGSWWRHARASSSRARRC